MAKIRSDLDGVVVIPGAEPVVLHAGDEVPEGVEVGEHVLDAPGAKPVVLKTPRR